jgi:hypothetical protein
MDIIPPKLLQEQIYDEGLIEGSHYHSDEEFF